MARWVDVRVPAEQFLDAQRTLTILFPGGNFRFDPTAKPGWVRGTQPAASGPEHELSVQDRPEELVVNGLRSAGYHGPLRPALGLLIHWRPNSASPTHRRDG